MQDQIVYMVKWRLYVFLMGVIELKYYLLTQVKTMAPYLCKYWRSLGPVEIL